MEFNINSLSILSLCFLVRNLHFLHFVAIQTAL